MLRTVAALALLWSGASLAQGVPANCPSNLSTADVISHDFDASFCELCGVGTVRLEIENPYRRVDDVDMSELVITEDLGASGLTYVTGSTRVNGVNIGTPSISEPVVGGVNGRRHVCAGGPAQWRRRQQPRTDSRI